MDDHSDRRDGAEGVRESAAVVQQRLAYDRTFLANERTYAAWLRTGLAVSAGGIAIVHLIAEATSPSSAAFALGASFVLLGLAVMAYGARQFVHTARAMARETGRAVGSSPRIAYALTLVIAALLIAVLVLLAAQRGLPPT